MDQIPDILAPEPATDEPGSPSNPSALAEPGEPGFVAPLISDCLTETFQPAGRKPRHDGWTPERVGEFLHMLAACGVVEDSCKLVGLSAASAYAFRNRREGRAFARVWDAILIHRSRARLAGELMSRSMNGCIEAVQRGGAVVAERHRYDNRLSMAMLTRLDRLAEKEAPNEDHLRALSEDMEEFIDCAAAGGDLDAFVEGRRPLPPAPPPPSEPDSNDDLTTFAGLAGCRDFRDEDPREIEVLDLDPTRRGDWEPEQWIRAFRSGFMTWLDVCAEDDPDFDPAPWEPTRYAALRAASHAAADLDSDDPANPMEMARQGRHGEIDTADLDPAQLEDWTDEQLARGWCSRLLSRLPDSFWEAFAADDGDAEPGG
jgi:hypothetical protein